MVQGLLYLGLSLWNEEDLMPVHGLGSLQGLSPLYQFKVKSQALCVIGTSLAPYDKCLHQSLSILVSLCINCKSLLHARFLLHFRRFCPSTLGVLIFRFWVLRVLFQRLLEVQRFVLETVRIFCIHCALFNLLCVKFVNHRFTREKKLHSSKVWTNLGSNASPPISLIVYACITFRSWFVQKRIRHL